MAAGPLRINSDYYDALHKLGFTKKLSEKRVKIYENAAECSTVISNRDWDETVQVIIPGSRGEGIAVSIDSDLDMIFLQPAIMCFETHPKEESLGDKYVATFQLDFEGVPEGYAKLRLKSFQAELKPAFARLESRIKESLTEGNYLRNDRRLIGVVELGGENVKREGWISRHYRFVDKAGPSQPCNITLPVPGKFVSLSEDHVLAFPCSYPSLFDKWSKRKRTGDWPSVDDQEEVKKTDVFVVPVGRAGSEEETLQWRISFTLAERYLVRSFNDTQIKVYVAMKMLVKHVLRPICSNLTSYVVKNVVFWVFENRSDTFTRNDFNEILINALEHLKDCVEQERLDNYIIPHRNLLLGKNQEKEKDGIINRIASVIAEGPSALERCPLIHDMFNLPEEAFARRLLARRLLDELMMSLLSLEPSYCDNFQQKIHKAQTQEDILNEIRVNVLPVIRKTNPFDYYKLLISMKVEEVFRLIIESQIMGYDKTWR